MAWLHLKTRPTAECFVTNMLMRAWGHEFIYDAPTLRYAMEAEGFHDIVEQQPRKSGDPALDGIDIHDKVVGLEMNDQVTMVLEGTR